MAAQIMPPDALTQAIIMASDPTASHENRVEASSILDQVRSSALSDAAAGNGSNSSGDGGSTRAIQAVLNLLVSGSSSDERVVFFCMTIIQAYLESEAASTQTTAVPTRLEIRRVVLGSVLGISTNYAASSVAVVPPSLNPSYVKTKFGVVLALLVRADFMDTWNTAFDDLMKHLLGDGQTKQHINAHVMFMVREEVYLRSLEAICDEIIESPPSSCIDRCNAIKDVMRGYRLAGDGSNIAPSASISGRIVDSILSLLNRYRALMTEATSNGNNGSQILHKHADQMAVLSLSVLKRYAPWVDLSLMLNDQTIVPLLFSCVSSAGTGGDDVDATPRTDLCVQAVACLSEIVGRGMESDQKIALIVQLGLFRRLHDATQAGINISDVDVTHVDAVIAVAELICKVGEELLHAWDEYLAGIGPASVVSSVDVDTMAMLLRQLVSLFFPCYAYDDIDVSGAVIPLASRLTVTLGKEKDRLSENGASTGLAFTVSEHLPQLFTIMYKQMCYPEDYDFDFEDDDEAEEEQYRTSLRKLYQAIIRVSPDLALQFLCSVLSGIPSPLSTAPTPELEAALRLVYHYCEGIRPPPGLKTVMKNETFREVLVAIHRSDITSHPHREVLMLYYDLSVRYYPILRDIPELLPPILSALSGVCGLQHPHPRMRSRACYLLLKLIKAIPTVLQPYAETAVNGIQGLLSNPTAFPIEADDKLYLFEAIGILLGKTGMDVTEQQRYLTGVMTPHVHSIEEVLTCANARSDPETWGTILSASVSAIAFLSKGFKNNPCQEVQVVLLETVGICLRVLQALPENEEVRSKCMIYLQRMILCLGQQILSAMPAFLELLIAHCTNQDVLDVSHLLNQLCSKFKSDAIGAIDAAVSPFLRKCYSLMPSIDEVVGQGDIPPHLLTEQLSIKKISYSFLQHVVTYKVTPVFSSANNASSFEQILQFMSDGAINVREPILKKSCIMFFRLLAEQWAADGSLPSEHLALQRGLVQFLDEIIVPGLIKSLLDPSYNEKDAMQSRNVTQTAKLLAVLREKRGAVEFERVFIANVLIRAQCPDGIIVAFRLAPDVDGIEKALREMLAAMKGGW